MGHRQPETITHISGGEQWVIDSQNNYTYIRGRAMGYRQPETISHISVGEQWVIDS